MAHLALIGSGAEGFNCTLQLSEIDQGLSFQNGIPSENPQYITG